MKLQIITPDGAAVTEGADLVTLPGVEGQFGVYPRHVPLLTQMIPGEIIIRKDAHDHSFAVGEGLIEVTSDQINVLTDMAIPADHIDEARVEEARQRAEARLRDKLSDEEVASTNASLARALAQINVKRRRRQ